MIIAVGSKNKTKIIPVKKVFSFHFKNVKVIGVPVNSKVREQPLHDTEMYEGALNRAKKALEQVRDAEYGVGVEGGIHEYAYGVFERSIVVIVNRKGEIGVGSSGGLVLPKRVISAIKRGKTLEEAVDDLFGTKKIGEGIGMFGLFTKGYVTRASGVEHGVAFALARFLHKNLY